MRLFAAFFATELWLVDLSSRCATRRHINPGGVEGAEEMDACLSIFYNGTPYLSQCGLYDPEYPKTDVG